MVSVLHGGSMRTEGQMLRIALFPREQSALFRRVD